jgi:hypothetical protein
MFRCAEEVAECRAAIFNNPGTLTYGVPNLTVQLVTPGFL